MLPVGPCVVSFSKFHESDMHDLLWTGRYSIFVVSSSDTSDTPYFLVTC